MTNWTVLGLSHDPAPGDPVQVRATAHRFLGQADLLARMTSRLSSIAASSGGLAMTGDYATGFQSSLDELPAELATSQRSYRRCGQALSAFSTSLEQAQSVAGTALRRGTEADQEYAHAVQQVRMLLPGERQVMVSSGLGLSDFSIDAATSGLDEELRSRIRMTARRARQAEAERDAARGLALQAVQLRGDAETRCADEINDSLDGIRNKHWWQKAWDVASAPVRSWDGFVSFCSTAAMVLGVVALVVSGPIGWALMAAAALAGTMVLADGLDRFRKGEIGPGELALDLLGVLPGVGLEGRAVGILGRLARSAPITGEVFTASVRVASRARSTVRETAARAWPRIADSFTRVREQAIPMAKRTFGRDPIDMASGDVVLQQTDLRLPGLLELVLERTHLSSYRAGRWFGPSWASFLNQRLEIGPAVTGSDPDGGPVLFAGADTTVLCFVAAPGAGETVTPVEGPRLELRLAPDAGRSAFQLTDPKTGVTRWFGRREQISGGDQILPLTAVSDRNGHRIELDHTSDGTLTSLRHSGGYHVRIDTKDNRIVGLRLLPPAVEETSGGTLKVSYRYDDAGRLAEVVNSSGLPLRFDYDPAGRLARWEDRNGSWYQYTYDEEGRCTRTSGSGGCLAGELAYHHDGEVRTTVEVDSLGHATTYQLNDLTQVVAVTDPLGNVRTTEWDAFDHQLAVTDALGATTRFGYDESLNLTSVHRPGGSMTRITYNALQLPELIIQPDGTRSAREYDDHGNLTAVTDPLGARTSLTYTATGGLLSVTDPRGARTSYVTDGAGLPVSAVDPLGVQTHYLRDDFGRITSVQDADGAESRSVYSPEGWLTERTTPATGSTRWEYDGEGNVVSETDSAGRTTTTRWTHFDLPATRTLPDGSQLAYSYDTELRLVAVTDGLGRIWSFEYDAAGRLVRESDVNGRILTYAYDGAGRMIQRGNGSAGNVGLSYDPAGNLVRKQVGSETTVYTYDRLDRMIRAVCADADLVLERDPLGRVIGETCNGLTSTFDYDTTGRRTGRRTPSGAVTSHVYDPAGRLAELCRGGRTLVFTHDELGRETSRSLSPAAVLEQTWSAGQQLLAQSIQTIGGEVGGPLGRPRSAGRQYGYDAQGRLITVEDGLRGRTDFDLDALGQVTTSGSSVATEPFAYDRAGSLVSAGSHTPGPAGPHTRTLSGTVTKRAGAWRFSHDSRGRMVLRQHKTLSAKARTWHYTWNADDQLIAVTTPDGTLWRYRYDGLGRRFAKQRIAADGVTVVEEQRFVWDVAVLAERITSTSATTWDWHPDAVQPLTQSHRVRDDDQSWYDDQFYAIVTDLIGTPAEMIDELGQVVWSRQSSLWGQRLTTTETDVDCPLEFPGQYRDDETGLHYNVLRYYDPAVGSFVSPDPLGILAGPNPHTYVPNPTTHIDPLGLAPCQMVGGAARDPVGRISARTVRFTQDSIGSHFKDGSPVLDLAQTVTNDSARMLTPIRIFQQDGVIHSIDNRRLFAGQYADVHLPFNWATPVEIAQRRRTELFNGTGIEMRGIGWWQNP